MQREGDRFVHAGASTCLAGQLPRAKLILLRDSGHLKWCQDADALIDAHEMFA